MEEQRSHLTDFLCCSTGTDKPAPLQLKRKTVAHRTLALICEGSSSTEVSSAACADLCANSWGRHRQAQTLTGIDSKDCRIPRGPYRCSRGAAGATCGHGKIRSSYLARSAIRVICKHRQESSSSALGASMVMRQKHSGRGEGPGWGVVLVPTCAIGMGSGAALGPWDFALPAITSAEAVTSSMAAVPSKAVAERAISSCPTGRFVFEMTNGRQKRERVQQKLPRLATGMGGGPWCALAQLLLTASLACEYEI